MAGLPYVRLLSDLTGRWWGAGMVGLGEWDEGEAHRVSSFVTRFRFDSSAGGHPQFWRDPLSATVRSARRPRGVFSSPAARCLASAIASPSVPPRRSWALFFGSSVRTRTRRFLSPRPGANPPSVSPEPGAGSRVVECPARGGEQLVAPGGVRGEALHRSARGRAPTSLGK